MLRKIIPFLKLVYIGQSFISSISTNEDELLIVRDEVNPIRPGIWGSGFSIKKIGGRFFRWAAKN